MNGGFTVDGGHHRHLDQQARRLGFADLRGCLQALLDDGWSVPQLATHLDTTQTAIRAAIKDGCRSFAGTGVSCEVGGSEGVG